MAWSGFTFTIQNTFTPGTTILSSQVNANYTDIATGMTQMVAGTQPFNAIAMLSTDAGAAAGPDLELYRNSASPADGDVAGQLLFYAKDDGGNKTLYGSIQVALDDVSNGTEDGELRLRNVTAGSLSTKMFIGSTRLSYGSGYAVDNTSTRSSFSAHKNGTSQSIATSAATKITFGTEIFDVGSNFASSTWTPPAGTCAVEATITYDDVTAGIAVLVYIYKNGAFFKGSKTVSTETSTINVSIIDQCNGTDTYEVYAQVSDTYSISGLTYLTYFMGTMV